MNNPKRINTEAMIYKTVLLRGVCSEQQHILYNRLQ